MSSTVATQANNRSGQRSRRGNRGRGGGRAPPQNAENKTAAKSTPAHAEVVVPAENRKGPAEEEDGGAEVCFICAEPVKYYSLSECNHRTCHCCALRLRALYKKLECTFCKESQASVIFTVSPDKPWASYTPDTIPYRDSKLSISFETHEMMEDTLILLRFNCPDPDCPYVGNGWSDLKLHTRATHGKLMCDLCIRFKKVFAHEHALYTPNQLPTHLPSMYRSGKPPPQKEQVEGGIHPLCVFCKECFFGDDELYSHMRERHEECFVCKRNEIRDQYFRNYDALEQHFTNAHHPCTHPQCLVHKFVVFGSTLDLKAHMVEEHGADMSSRDKRDARRIQAEFGFEETNAGARHGRRDRGDREREREREREPPPHVAPVTGASRANTAGSRRREAFSGSLTVENTPTTNGASPNHSQQPSRHQTPSPPQDADADRFTGLVARVSSLASHPNSAVPVVKSAVRSFHSSESAARDLISTVWNVLDRNLDGTASILNTLVDITDDEDKKRDLLAAWNSFKIEQRGQFPELVPTATGSEWAGIAGGRVLNAKHMTASRASSQSSRQLWDRVARAAGSSSSTPPPRPPERFPALQASHPPFRQPQRNTPWASSSATSPAPPPVAPVRGPVSVPGPGAQVQPQRVKAPLSKSAFPELPTSTAARVHRAAVGGNQSLRNILGEAASPQQAWGAGGASGTTTPLEANGDGEERAPELAVGRGKKGKGKQKQTLFTLGSFPT